MIRPKERTRLGLIFVLCVAIKLMSAQGPVISVTPDSLSDSLFTGETSLHWLSIANEGDSNLIFGVSISAPSQVIIDEDFNSGFPSSDFGLYESAFYNSSEGNIYLTIANGDQTGGLFYNELLHTDYIRVAFDFEIGGGSGADGMVLAFLDSIALGLPGGNLGFYGTSASGWGIEFDTWQNEYETENHIAVANANGTIYVTNDTIPELEDNGTFSCEAIFNQGHLEVYLENSSIGYPNTKVIDYTFAGITQINHYTGFTAATGGATNNHIVDNLQIATTGIWISVMPTSGTVLPDLALIGRAIFDATGMNGGEYLADINIASNDPINPLVTIPAYLHVTGIPNINVSEDTLDYGNVFVGASPVDTLLVSNVGTDVLTVSDISTDNPDYSVDTASFTLIPDESRAVLVSFAPSTVGPITASLTITSDDPDQPVITVHLIGQGVAPPIITVNPDYLGDTLTTGETSQQSIVIGNIGAYNLAFTITEAAFSSSLTEMEAVATISNSKEGLRSKNMHHDHYHHTETTQKPPSISRSSTLVSPPVRSVPIIDGLFSEGEWNDAVSVAATVIGNPQGEERGKVYVKNTLGSIYVLIDYHSTTGGNDENITGDIWFDLDNNGTDDGGFFSNISEGVLNAEWDYPAIMEFSNSGSPNDSNPHWILEYKIPLSSLGIITEDTMGIHFVLYDFNGTGSEWENLTTFFDYNFPATWADLVLSKDVSWLSVYPDTGTVTPGDSVSIDVTYDAMRCVSGGDHYANLIVSSNDPITPVDSALCYLNVIATPDIVLSTDTLDFDVVFVDYADTIAFQVYNIGSDTLDVSNITTDNANYSVNTTNFSLPPDENQTVLVIFAPSVVGVSSGNLTVHSNDANNPAVNVVLIGEGVDAPIINVYPEYISDTLFTGESANHNLTIGNIGGSDLSFEISIASLPPALERMQETVVIADSKHNGYSNDLVNTPNIGNNESVSIDRNNKDASRTEFLQMERNTIVRSPEPVPNSFSRLRTEYENYALKFDGVDDYVNLPTLTPITSTPINKFTFEGWINVFAPTNDIQQFMEGHTSTWEIFVELETGTNPMVFHISDNSGAGYAVQTSPISFSTWHHIAATYDGYDQRIYLDGVLQDSISWSNTFTITTGITLGKDFDISSQYLNGLIDEVRIWSVARTQSEIQANMYRQIFGNEPGLICYWRLNEGTGYTAFDQTSNHNNGSLQGGVAWTASTAPILPAWLTASPDSGTVPAASSMDVDICLSAVQMHGGNYHANLVILSNDPATSEDTVLCFLHVIAAPDIDLSTDTLNFDSVLVNYSDTLELQVYNIGTDTLVVSNIKPDNIDYSVDTTNFALLPYEHQTVLVTFAPSGAGSITGNLIILSNDPDEPADTVALIGVGMTGITEAEKLVPTVFFVSQNSPNPFRQHTAIHYGCPQRCEVELAIFDITGRLITILLMEEIRAGSYTVYWNGTDEMGRKVPSGVYLLKFKTENYSAKKKLLLSK